APRSISEREKPSDRRLRRAVEEVQPVGIHGEAKPVADFRLDGRLHRGRHRAGADLDVQEDLRPELLDDLDHGIEGEVCRVAAGRYAQILGADSEYDLFSRISAKPACDPGRQPDVDAFVVSP